MEVACGEAALRPVLQDKRAERNAEADGELLVDRHQAVAAAGLVRAQVGDGQGVHGGKLDGVAGADEEQQDYPYA